MTIYKLYDYYKGKKLIGKFDNWHDLHQAKLRWIDETDGECVLIVKDVIIESRRNNK